MRSHATCVLCSSHGLDRLGGPTIRRNDNETIEASKIEPGSTIHMVLSLRGGRA
jgi:hypothetical protein